MKRSELIKHIPVPEKREKCICVELFRSCGKDVLMVSGYVCPYYGYESRRIYTVHFVWESGYLTWNESGQWTRESVYSAGFHKIGRKKARMRAMDTIENLFVGSEEQIGELFRGAYDLVNNGEILKIELIRNHSIPGKVLHKSA